MHATAMQEANWGRGGGRRRGKERERAREVYGELEKRAGQESGISKVAQTTTKY